MCVLNSYLFSSYAQEPPPVEVDALPAGCSLHVPMDVEFAASCFPRIPPP